MANEGERAGELTRRKFAHATVKAGLAASAAVWVAPQISSVALAQTTAGSPPPSPTTSAPTTTSPTTAPPKKEPPTPNKAPSTTRKGSQKPGSPPAATPVRGSPDFTG